MPPVYLVDGSGYIFRAFFAIAPLSNSKGLPTNALFGFTRMLAKLIRDVDARYLAVTFDTPEPTFRHKLYDQYKANRDECPAELIPQMPYFRKIVKAFGVQSLEKPGVEADDVIATLTKRFRSLGQEVVVVSGDKDLLQLVDEHVKVFDAMRDVTFDKNAVVAKFGVSPAQMRDYLALVGDSSDNVPGVKGIGPKTAQQLLAHFGSIDELIIRVGEIEGIKGLRGAKGLREKIESGVSQLRLSQRLVSLDSEVEPYSQMTDVELFRWSGVGGSRGSAATIGSQVNESGAITSPQPPSLEPRSFGHSGVGGLAESGALSVTSQATANQNLGPLFDSVSCHTASTIIPASTAKNTAKNIESDSVDIESLFEELEFTKLLSTLNLHGLESKAVSSGGSNSIYDSKKFNLVTSESFPQFVKDLSSQSRFAFDTETTGLDVRTAELVGISFSWKEGEGFFVPLASKAEPERNLQAEAVREALGPVFSNSRIEKYGSNLKFDIGILEQHGYRVLGASFDTMIASHMLHPDRRQNGLKALAQNYLNESMINFEEVVGESADISSVPLDRVSLYACHDAEASFRLAEKLGALLGSSAENSGPSMYKAFAEVEMPLIPVLSRMERTGIKVDVGYLEALGEEFVAELVELEQSIHELAGRNFNINSPKQLAVVLFEDLQLPTAGVKKTQSGYSTDASVLSKLSAHYPIAAKLLEYRELHKLNSTYVEALKRLADPKTHRIHTSFNQAIAATGRLSSTEPNLQNIPIRNPRGRRLRQAFVADSGFVLISADYSQIELRILAHLSGDKNLQQAFLDGEDIHEKTARELFGTAISTPAERKELRRVAKTINFGIVYGMGAFRLAGDLGISRKQAQQYIDEYYARYPGVQRFYDTLRERIEHEGYVETMFGRRRFRHEIDTSGRDAGYAERSLLNAPIQGSAAEVIKAAMIKIDQQLSAYSGQAKMVLQVHDELLFEVRADILDEVQQMVVNTMETAVPTSIPLKVDVRSGASWGEEVW